MFVMGRAHRGDTIVEVLLAFSIFTLVAVGTNAVMNRGIALAEKSLETTLVRAQIDAQAELLRYAQSVDSDVWNDDILNLANKGKPGDTPIEASDIPDLSDYVVGGCPDDAPEYSFMLNVTDGDLTFIRLDPPPPKTSSYVPATVHSQFDARVTSPETANFSGIWVVPIETTGGAAGGSTTAYDMHIGTCWYVPGSDTPMTLGTIVRLYDGS